MIEAYKIAANLTITGDAQKKMMEFYTLVEKTTKKMEFLQKLLKLTGNTFGGLGREIKTTTMSMRDMDNSLTRIGNHSTRVRTQVEGLRRSVNSLSIAARGGGGGHGLGGWGNLGGVMLGALGHRLAPAAVAYGAYNVTKASFNQYSEYTAGLARVKAMGYGQDVINQVQGATGTGKPGLSPTTQINAYVAALMATQSPEKAKNLFPSLAKAMTYAPTIFGNMNKHQIEEATRAAELLGGGDESKIGSAFSDVLAMMALSGGTIQPAKIKQLVRKNPSLSRLGMLELEPVVQEMGGDVVSTALRTGKMQLLKGQMGKFQALGLQDLGILGAPRFDKNGRPLGSKYGDLKPGMRELAFSNPTEFLKTVILPALAKQGITDPKEITGKLNFLFANTYGQLFENIYRNLPKSELIRERAGRVPGIEGLIGTAPKEGTAVLRFNEAIKSFETALGHFSSPAVVKGLNIVSFFLEKMAVFLEKSSLSDLGRWMANSIAPGSGYLLGAVSGAITSIPTNTSQSKNTGHIYLDSKKVGNIIWGKTPNQMVDHGSTSILPSYQGVSPSNNNLGGGVSA